MCTLTPLCLRSPLVMTRAAFEALPDFPILTLPSAPRYRRNLGTDEYPDWWVADEEQYGARTLVHWQRVRLVG